MLKSKTVRNVLLGSAAAVALVGVTSTAQAVETEFGEVQIIFDTTVSMGASMRVADRETGIPQREPTAAPLIRAADPALGSSVDDVPRTSRRSTARPVGGLRLTTQPRQFRRHRRTPTTAA